MFETVKDSDPIVLSPTKREKYPLRSAAWVSGVLAIIALLTAAFSRSVYDHVLPTHSTASLAALTIGMVFALLADGILRFLRARWIEASGEAYDSRVAEELFERLLRTRMTSMPRAASASSMFKEFEAVRDLNSTATVSAFVDAASTVLFIAVLAVISWQLALATLLGMSVMAGAWILQKSVTRRSKISYPTAARRQALLHESALGAEDVKLARAEKLLAQEMGLLTSHAAHDSASLRWMGSLVGILVASASGIVQTAILALGSLLVIQGQISMGTLIAASILSGRAMAPCSSLAAAALKVGRARSAASAIKALADAPKEHDEQRVTLEKCNGELKIEGVKFHYPGRESPALNGVSFSLGSGAIVGIIGPRGCGKSTLGRLLSGLAELDPQRDSGSILLDGIPISQITRDSLRKHIGVCPQDAVLFSRSIKANIALSCPNISDEKIIEAAKIACADDWILRLPAGFGTEVVEQGRTMSGGERQSVALARTIISDPRIIFLDEPTSHFDPVSTSKFVENMRIWLQGRTAIIATHRPEILSICSAVLVMEKGQVTAVKKPEEVLGIFNQKLPSKDIAPSPPQSDSSPRSWRMPPGQPVRLQDYKQTSSGGTP